MIKRIVFLLAAVALLASTAIAAQSYHGLEFPFPHGNEGAEVILMRVVITDKGVKLADSYLNKKEYPYWAIYVITPDRRLKQADIESGDVLVGIKGKFYKDSEDFVYNWHYALVETGEVWTTVATFESNYNWGISTKIYNHVLPGFGYDAPGWDTNK